MTGLTDIDEHTVACIQDENGILFLYDLRHNGIKDQFQFHIDGDYEGATRVGDAMYILRSDATLFEIDNYKRKDFALHTYPTAIPAKDNQGLCFDEANNRLLIGCKSKLGKDPEFKDKRAIYAFDLPTRSRKNKGVPKEVPVLKFMTSAISVHPIRNELFLLSASDQLFFIFDMSGKVLHMEPLDPKVFNKAEGITYG